MKQPVRPQHQPQRQDRNRDLAQRTHDEGPCALLAQIPQICPQANAGKRQQKRPSAQIAQHQQLRLVEAQRRQRRIL